MLASEQRTPDPRGESSQGTATWERVAAIYAGRSQGLASLLEFRPAGVGAEIVTPFLDPNNAKISLYVRELNGGFELNDGGVASRIVGMARRPDGEAIFEGVLGEYGLRRMGEQVCLSASREDLPSRQLRLCTALIYLMDRLRGVPAP